MPPVFEIDSNHAGTNDLGDVRPDRGRTFAVPSLDIRAHRHIRRPHDTRGCGDDLGPRRGFSVRIT